MKLYKFRSLTSGFDRTLDIIVNQRLFCAPYGRLNDPFEGMLKLVSEIPSSMDMIDGPFTFGLGSSTRRFHTDIGELSPEISNTRVCSLSKSYKDVRMWALYADSFSGMAIEIELPDDLPELHPVEYSKGLPEIKKAERKNINSIDVLTKKTDHWSYEQEVRIISDKAYYSVEGKVTGIYYGIRTSDMHKEIIDKVGAGIKMYDTLIDRDTVSVFTITVEGTGIFQ